jgi:hypothetical protein
MDLLTTYIGHSEQQVITASLLIFIIQKIMTTPAKLFPAAVSSTAVP